MVSQDTSPKRARRLERYHNLRRQDLKHQNRISPGLLLLDTFLRPIYVNDEAVSILSYPQAPRGNGHRAYFLKQRIDSLPPRRNGSRDPKFSGEFASGRRRYQVRVFAMKSNSQNHSGPTLAVLLERNRKMSLPISGLTARGCCRCCKASWVQRGISAS